MAPKCDVYPPRMRSPLSCSSKPLPKSSTDTNLFEMPKKLQPCLFLAQISAFPDTGHSSVCLRETGTGRNRPEAATQPGNLLVTLLQPVVDGPDV